jgi:geranylgeranyl transferase type-2 subunit beta
MQRPTALQHHKCCIAQTAHVAIEMTRADTVHTVGMTLLIAAPADCRSLQLPDGSFKGDEWGEVDVRFVYSALNCCALLSLLDQLDVKRAVAWVLQCQNFDGAFGAAPGCESHTGHVFCCVGALSIAGAIDKLDSERLGRWCAGPSPPCPCACAQGARVNV